MTIPDSVKAKKLKEIAKFEEIVRKLKGELDD